MSLSENTYQMLSEMTAAGVDFIVVGGSAAILGGAFVVTEDLDIVHRRTPENIARLLPWLNAHGAYHRYDLANRRLPPREDALLGHGHLNLQLDIGKLDVLCELRSDRLRDPGVLNVDFGSRGGGAPRARLFQTGCNLAAPGGTGLREA